MLVLEGEAVFLKLGKLEGRPTECVMQTATLALRAVSRGFSTYHLELQWGQTEIIMANRHCTKILPPVLKVPFFLGPKLNRILNMEDSAYFILAGRNKRYLYFNVRAKSYKAPKAMRTREKLDGPLYINDRPRVKVPPFPPVPELGTQRDSDYEVNELD